MTRGRYATANDQLIRLHQDDKIPFGTPGGWLQVTTPSSGPIAGTTGAPPRPVSIRVLLNSSGLQASGAAYQVRGLPSTRAQP